MVWRVLESALGLLARGGLWGGAGNLCLLQRGHLRTLGWQHQWSPWLSGSLHIHELSREPWLCRITCRGFAPSANGAILKKCNLTTALTAVKHETMKEDFSLKWKKKKRSKILKILQLFQCMWRMKFKQIFGLPMVYERLFWNSLLQCCLKAVRIQKLRQNYLDSNFVCAISSSRLVLRLKVWTWYAMGTVSLISSNSMTNLVHENQLEISWGYLNTSLK